MLPLVPLSLVAKKIIAPCVEPEVELAAPRQHFQQAFLLCRNLQPAGAGEPEELRYSQAEICKENALY